MKNKKPPSYENRTDEVKMFIHCTPMKLYYYQFNFEALNKRIYYMLDFFNENGATFSKLVYFH